MASLQVRHSRSCQLGRPWTPADVRDGCTCHPTFYVVFRDDGGKLVRERVGKNAKQGVCSIS